MLPCKNSQRFLQGVPGLSRAAFWADALTAGACQIRHYPKGAKGACPSKNPLGVSLGAPCKVEFRLRRLL